MALGHDEDMMKPTPLANGPGDIDLGVVVLRPARRTVAGPGGRVTVEPLVMKLIGALAKRAGRVTERRALFEVCWQGAPVGDDSLNRLVAAARKALRTVGDGRVAIETVPGAGYALTFGALPGAAPDLHDEAAAAVQCALSSWRAAFPSPDLVAIERLNRVVEADPTNPAGWGVLALMLRHATEYGEIDERAEFVALCEQAVGNALALDPTQPEAHIARAGIVPIFGNWSIAYQRLSEVLALHPGHVIASHDLSIVEMSTGRVEAASAIIDPLLAVDPLAPSFGYKSTYHHWSLGHVAAMDLRADRALQLWPQHPAVWTARFWTLAHTGRPAAALSMIEPSSKRPAVTEPVAQFLRRLLTWKIDGGPDADALAQEAADAVITGPSQAINSLMALGLLGDVDRAFLVAEGYYLQGGRMVVPQHGNNEIAVNENRRRLTQILFTPACAGMRADARFASLCDRIGLAAYWETTGRQPDFLRFG